MELTQKEIEARESLKTKKPLVYEKVMRYEEKWERGEPIPIIQLFSTLKCPLNCVHCSVFDLRKQERKRTLGLKEYKSISDQAHELGLAHIDITGGESFFDSNLESIIETISPERFFLQIDTSGYKMTQEKINNIKNMGFDKIQISVDNLNEREHDEFRRKKGCWRDAIETIDYAKNAGLKVQVSTVIDHKRIHSEEFIQFLEFMKEKEVATAVIFPKFVGAWAGRYDLMVTRKDVKYVYNLSKRFHLYDHLTPAYGRTGQCLAVKRMVSIWLDGSLVSCPWMPFSLGNIFDTPLKDILDKGMKYFGKHQKLCLASESKEFIEKYISKTYGRKDLPVPIEEIMPDGKYDIG